MIASALKLAQKWSVFPCKPGEKIPATLHGCKDATRDPELLRTMWIPDANIGVACGRPSGIWVLDVDGEEGFETLIGLSGDMIPVTLTQATPSGGYHFIFADPGNLGNTCRKLGPGLDTRGDGGYILAAPSRTSKGSYRWVERIQPATPPGWLMRLIRPAQPVAAPTEPRLRIVGPNETRTEKYAQAALKAEHAQLACMAPQTGRNHQLNRAAFNLGGLIGAGMLDSATVHAVLLDAAGRCGLLNEDGKKKCEDTIASGLTAGRKKPRTVAS